MDWDAEGICSSGPRSKILGGGGLIKWEDVVKGGDSCRSVAWQRACMNSTLLTWSSRAEQLCAIGLRMARAKGHASASQ